MTLKTIKIENIKGISNQQFDLDIIPNKPSILVAPNGFGKTSFACAFSSLNTSRLNLSKEFYHCKNDANKPKLTVTVDRNGNTEELVADENSNQISNGFDIHVLNTRLKVKSTKRNMGHFTSATASLAIEQLILVNNIPTKTNFEYKITEARKAFGENGKILNSIDVFLRAPGTAELLLDIVKELRKLDGVRRQAILAEILAKINERNGNRDQIISWAQANVEVALEAIDPIARVADLFNRVNESFPLRLDKLLAAYQIYQLYNRNNDAFKKACKYKCYLDEKDNYDAVIRSFDTTWQDIKPREHKGKLVVDFPLATDISNGQRDSLSFAAWLQKVTTSSANRDCIVIIDEVFDYLDDANLVAVQYYISGLIKAKKASGGRVYPLILTHLNPLYFKNFIFKDQKVYFLKQYRPQINPHLKKLIAKRDDSTICEDVSGHHLHFSPNPVDLRTEFYELNLKKTWGDSRLFYDFLDEEWTKYANNEDDYDPFAICCYARVKIEESVYRQLPSSENQCEFLKNNGTRKKLDFAESCGISIEETMYLLGVIYNEGMHIKENVDNSSPIVAKLENLVIRKMLLECLGS